MKTNQWKLAVAGLLTVGLLSACQPIQPMPEAAAPPTEEAASAEIPLVTLKVTEAGLEAPSEIPSGIVAVAVEGGSPENMPQLARLNEGVTMEQVTEAVAGPDPMAALALVSLLGSAATVDGQVIYDLQPGSYAAVLFMPDSPPQVVPVTSGEPSGAVAPTADVSATLLDFSFAIPDKIATGPQVWQIENSGQQWHEMGIVKLNEGVTVEDVLAWVQQSMGPEGPSGPPPFEEGAFWGPMGAGQRAWVTWDIAPGEYTVICFLPDLAGDMSPHAAHGMVRTLVVE